MDPALVFRIANVLPLPIWAIWMLAPRSRAARTLAVALWPWAILCAIYVGAVAVALGDSGGFDPSSFGTLDSVMKLFDSRWGTLAGWVHYLAFDLFVGRWIMNDAPDAGYRVAPILFLTLMFGPAGLLLYLATRRFISGRPAAA
jgi:Domain of unknown function (DUF4281)